MTGPRQIAALAVKKVTDDGGYSNLVLNSLLDESKLSGEDKALATAIFYGTLDRMVTIDFFLKKLIKTPLKKLKPYTLAVLRTAVYQIKYLSRIPDSAAVNEAVKLIKKSKEGFNVSFVNAVLRNLIREDIPLPTGNSAYDISIAYSCPQWIVSVLIRDYGIQFTKAFLENALLTPPVYFRVNTLKTTADTLKTELEAKGVKVVACEEKTALEADTPGSVENMPAYKEGLFFVQDISCQKAVASLDIKTDSRVLDLCAAPGGKSFSAAMYATEGEIVSCDLYEHRVGLIAEGAHRLGIKNLSARAADATVYDGSLGLFDRVICDVPCSGLGVIRRKPDIKYKPRDTFEELCEIQKGILNNADKYLKEGGKILYSTCTLNKAENRGIIDSFLENHSEYILENDYTFCPQEDNSDGFYAAVLSKCQPR